MPLPSRPTRRGLFGSCSSGRARGRGGRTVHRRDASRLAGSTPSRSACCRACRRSPPRSVVPAWGHLADVLVGRAYAFRIGLGVAIGAAVILVLPVPLPVFAFDDGRLLGPADPVPVARGRARGRRPAGARTPVRSSSRAGQPLVCGRRDRRRLRLRRGRVRRRPVRRARLVGRAGDPPAMGARPNARPARSGRSPDAKAASRRRAGSVRSAGCCPCSHGSWPCSPCSPSPTPGLQGSMVFLPIRIVELGGQPSDVALTLRDRRRSPRSRASSWSAGLAGGSGFAGWSCWRSWRMACASRRGACSPRRSPSTSRGW